MPSWTLAVLLAAVASVGCDAPGQRLEPRAAAPAGLAGAASASPIASPSQTPEEVLRAIAGEIEALKPSCPQLAELNAKQSFDPLRMAVTYEYHTHAPRHRGGWTSGVPNPDPDGVWLYIDLHEPSSMAQIHTQPAVPMLAVGPLKLMMLILEGEAVTPCAPRMWAILERHATRPSR